MFRFIAETRTANRRTAVVINWEDPCFDPLFGIKSSRLWDQRGLRWLLEQPTWAFGPPQGRKGVGIRAMLVRLGLRLLLANVWTQEKDINKMGLMQGVDREQDYSWTRRGVFPDVGLLIWRFDHIMITILLLLLSYSLAQIQKMHYVIMYIKYLLICSVICVAWSLQTSISLFTPVLYDAE